MIIYDTYTIFWRELKRYRKSRSGVLIRLIQPAIWIIVIGHTFAGTRPLIQSVGFDGTYLEFMAPGVIILTAIFTSIFGGVNTLWDRRYGFMNKALTSPISRSSIALGKMLAISLISALQAALIIGIAIIIGVTFPNPLVILPIMAIVILFSLGFSGISVVVASTAKSQETFWGIINFLGMPLFMLSPALFPLELLPEWLATAAKMNPVTYTVLLVRGMMTGVTEGVSTALSLGVIGVFVVLMIGLASYVFTREINKPF
ncbi:MAG: ABC transporter permease [Candidatus Nitrosotenuis sp.]|uniref:ABC-2 type transporter n=1 Tax=Candidatus Nitrosotenuis uzonensis TaxID=1407055 RepID=A0A812EYM2_9ARCH|nr:ABC transporter permease [Candidatus Nitrosotenuis uzonensis]MCA2003832.1 ABC transporter permease [Candidatus Nitrosotenuis sp.]CAE6484121.1 ABC-2 type transporter [Candidatus Nitrosotenuis uzonensis]